MFEKLLATLWQEGKLDVVVRVRPSAAKSRFVGVLDDGSLKVEVAAPAEGNKGNVMLAKFLGHLFAVTPQSVRILSGKTGRMKLVRIIKPD